MKSGFRTLGIRLVNRVVIPVAWASGIVTVLFLSAMIKFWHDDLSDGGRQIFGAFLSTFCLAIGYLIWRKRRAKALVASINLKEGLNLDNTWLLMGYPRPVFFAFDHASQKLAQCQSATGDYQIRDFSWVAGWLCEWQQIDNTPMGVLIQIVDGGSSSVPADEIYRKFIRFCLVLTVADTHQPILRFPMNRTEAEKWCTRCAVLFNS